MQKYNLATIFKNILWQYKPAWCRTANKKRTGWSRQSLRLQRNVAHIANKLWSLCSQARGGTSFKDKGPWWSGREETIQIKKREYTSPGPNYCWHVDGYDKLKPYGFPIHGAIDGYSRRIMWLKVDRTNNNPEVTASFFFKLCWWSSGMPYIAKNRLWNWKCNNCRYTVFPKGWQWWWVSRWEVAPLWHLYHKSEDRGLVVLPST